MPIRRRSNGSWLIDFYADGVRVRKTVKGGMPREDVEALEQALSANAELAVIRLTRPRQRPKHGGRRIRPNDAWRRVYHEAKGRAVRAGQPFLLSEQDMALLVAASRGCCALTGLPFCWDLVPGVSRRPYAGSLDRIDGRLPYRLENCRLVLVAVNFAINEWGEQTFARIAAAYQGRRRLAA